MLLWATVVVGALALAAWFQTRRLKRRIDQLNHSYWELRYEYTRLRAAVDRLDPSAAPPAPEPQPQRGDVGFVPLSSLRK
ncbi:MAG: hypothetical protein ACRD1S_12940 [Vicinamibacterales bacterium]